MFLYTVLVAVIGIAVGILLAVRTKKADGVTYGKLDRAGKILNIVLIPVYASISPFSMFIGMIGRTHYDGFWGLIGWILAVIAASATLFFGLGIGASVALRKQGKRKLSFVAQFAGFAAIAVMLVIFFTCYGNLLAPLN